ncbi:hypothetical protein [Streptomyces sp. Inha503]|uniref:hypothetical protein n=1 Tax=Streptomyces sp. Inha503 TaxID=3383314 RepID=UPI0039A3EFA6
MNAGTPSPAPAPITGSQEAEPSRNPVALDKLWRLSDELSTAVRAHLSERNEPNRPASATTYPNRPERDR